VRVLRRVGLCLALSACVVTSGCDADEDEIVRTLLEWLRTIAQHENEQWAETAATLPLEWRDAARWGVRVQVPIGAIAREEATATHFDRGLGGVTSMWVRVLDRGAASEEEAIELARLCVTPIAFGRLSDGRIEVRGARDELGAAGIVVASDAHAVCCHGPAAAEPRLAEICRSWVSLDGR
jgi:hypothetical protein